MNIKLFNNKLSKILKQMPVQLQTMDMNGNYIVGVKVIIKDGKIIKTGAVGVFSPPKGEK